MFTFADTMTDQANIAWSHLDKKTHITRLTDWANMLEKRLSELDPDYRAYPFGRRALLENMLSSGKY